MRAAVQAQNGPPLLEFYNPTTATDWLFVAALQSNQTNMARNSRKAFLLFAPGSRTRCPGLAFMEGNMRGPSSPDCETSFLRTGVVTAGMLAGSEPKPPVSRHAELVQIHLPAVVREAPVART
jgi:hypothetical protein